MTDNERTDAKRRTAESVTPEDDVAGRAIALGATGLVVITIAVLFVVRQLVDETQSVPPSPLLIEFPSERKTPSMDLPEIRFRDITRESGINFVHENGARGEMLLPEVYGSGCAFFDYNNDHAPDIVLVNGTVSPDATTPAGNSTLKLYRNNGAGQFEDVTDDAGIAHSFHGMGVAAGDFDNDGWVDLFFTSVGKNVLCHNNHGVFEDVTDIAGVAGDSAEWSTGACWFDAENDGDLDLFVCNYVQWSPKIDRSLDCRLLGRKRSYCHPDSFGGTFPRLYRNEGRGQFADISSSAGVEVRNSDTGVPVAKSLSVVPVDVDEDGWLDLVVANDGVANFLFRNQRDGTFAEAGREWGLAFDNSGRVRRATGLDVGWFRDVGTQTIGMGGISNQPTRFYCRQPGLSLFTEDSTATGLGPRTRTQFNFSLLFLDADLDSRLDVLTANGHVEPRIDVLQKSQSHAQLPMLLWNSGEVSTSEFVALPADSTGLGLPQSIVGRGAAVADIDADGDQDILLSANGGAPRLLRNDQSSDHHWVRLKLTGTRCNRDAIGAVIELTAGGTVRTRQVQPTRGYLSQSELIVTFGLGRQTSVDRLTIHWPNGTHTDLTDVAIDRLVDLTQE